jgi:hypothetical protein
LVPEKMCEVLTLPARRGLRSIDHAPKQVPEHDSSADSGGAHRLNKAGESDGKSEHELSIAGPAVFV